MLLPLLLLMAVILAVVVMPRFNAAVTIRRPEKAILMLELPKDDAELRGLLASPVAVESARANTKWDFGFIAIYTALFLSLGISMPPAPRMAMFIVAIATAAFDVWEDAVILRFLRDPAGGVASEIRFAACAKWFCFFVAVALVAMLFQHWLKWALVVIGAAGAVASLVGYRIGISVASDLAVLALAVAVIAFTVGSSVPPTSRLGTHRSRVRAPGNTRGRSR